MRTLMKFSFIGFLFVATACSATQNIIVQTESELYEECSEFSQAGMIDCLATKARESEKALSLAEAKSMRKISQWDEDQKYITIALAKLTAANQEFSQYRAKQCEYSSSLSGGGAGNSNAMGKLACTTEQNNRRAQSLLESIAQIPTK